MPARVLNLSFSLGKIVAAAAVAAGLLSSTMVDAKDLYVSPSGSDSVAYASNSISTPWKTIEHGLYNLQAGDKLYIRAGSYAPKYSVWLSSDYNRQTKGGDPNEKNVAQSGTASAPVVVQNYNGETVTVDLSAISDNYMSSYVYLDNMNYWTFKGLTFTNAACVFVVGEDYTSTHNTFDSLKVTMNRGGDNWAAIHLWGNRAEYTTITNNKIKGPGQNVHLNTGTIYVKGVNYLTIKNNVLSDAPIGIYYKHRNSATSQSQANVEVAYNYITNTSRASLEYNGSFTYIHDNIFGAGTAAAHFGDANGSAGADYNRIDHNTFLAGALNFDSAIESGDPFPGVQYNTITNNIFETTSEVLRYTSETNTNTFGKNMYPSTSAFTSYNSLLKVASSSIIGLPTYVGGANPTTIAGFALASNSLGKLGGTDGLDMGSNVSKFDGTIPVAPSPPTNVTVQ